MEIPIMVVAGVVLVGMTVGWGVFKFGRGKKAPAATDKKAQ